MTVVGSHLPAFGALVMGRQGDVGHARPRISIVCVRCEKA